MLDHEESQTTTQPPDPMLLMKEGTFPEHPLFPREDGTPETRDIYYVSFRRKRTDGRIDNCPEDVNAGEIATWAEVIGAWGGGEYKAIGKDRHHRVVACYPPENGGWLLFDQPSKPFTLRDGRRYGNGIEAPQPPAAAPAPAAPAPLAPPALSLETILLAQMKENAETQRLILSSALGTGGKAPGFLDGIRVLKEMRSPETSPIEFLRAAKELSGGTAATPGSLSDAVAALKQLHEISAPAVPAPTAPAEESFIAGFPALLTQLMRQENEARAVKALEPERPQPPPRPSRLVYLPGVGMVDVVRPDPQWQQTSSPSPWGGAGGAPQPPGAQQHWYLPGVGLVAVVAPEPRPPTTYYESRVGASGATGGGSIREDRRMYMPEVGAAGITQPDAYSNWPQHAAPPAVPAASAPTAPRMPTSYVPGVGLVHVVEPEPQAQPAVARGGENGGPRFSPPRAESMPGVAAHAPDQPVARERMYIHGVGLVDVVEPELAAPTVSGSAGVEGERAATVPTNGTGARIPDAAPSAVAPPQGAGAQAPWQPTDRRLVSVPAPTAGSASPGGPLPPRALGAPPPITTADVAAAPPATHAHRAAADVDVRDPGAVAAAPGRPTSSIEPASPVGDLRPQLVRDTLPASVAQAPARGEPAATRPTSSVAESTPAPRAGTAETRIADSPARAADGSSLGSSESSERRLTPLPPDRAGPSAVPSRADPAQPRSAAALGVHGPAAPVASASQRVIELPERMPILTEEAAAFRENDSPAAPGPELTAAECEQAAKTLRTVPPDQLLAQLKGIPGLAPWADDMVKALAAVPPEAFPMLVGKLPPGDVRALAAMGKNRKGG